MNLLTNEEIDHEESFGRRTCERIVEIFDQAREANAFAEQLAAWERLTALQTTFRVHVGDTNWMIREVSRSKGNWKWGVQPDSEEWTRGRLFDSPLDALAAIEQFESQKGAT